MIQNSVNGIWRPGLKLDRLDCLFCEGEVARIEPPRRIRPEEAGSAYESIKALVVAWSICLACRAKYTGWIDVRGVVDGVEPFGGHASDAILDLSFRSTFSDEPGPDDMPEFSVEWVPKLTPWPKCERCGKPRADSAECANPMEAECSDPECNRRMRLQ